MNTHVNFETAKLLKEKGFDELCDKKYIAQCLWQSPNSREQYKNSEIHQNSSDVTAPTIAEVVMWLYKKHRIWISVLEHNKNGKGIYFESFVNSMTFSGYNLPTEAYLEAINYTLKNLIK